MSQTTTRSTTSSTAVPALRAELLGQLNTLLRLTHTEEMIASVRRTQATSDAVERELARNAEMCRDRARLLRELIPALDGVYDVVAAAVGRLGAAAKAQLEQGITLPEALFSDLALEHQLLDRARYVKRLGEAAQQSQVIDVMERLETAHTATVEWIGSILVELAAGQPAKLRPTTAQAAGRRIAYFAARQAAHGVNRSVAAIGQAQYRVGHTAGDVSYRVARNADGAVGRLQRLDRDTNQVLTAGRDAALNRAEEVPREDGDDRVAEVVHETRSSLGVLRVDELPIPGYDTLNVGMASNAIEELLTYERAHTRAGRVSPGRPRRISEQSPPFT